MDFSVIIGARIVARHHHRAAKKVGGCRDPEFAELFGDDFQLVPISVIPVTVENCAICAMNSAFSIGAKGSWF